MTTERDIAATCACLKTRRAARAVTRAYDEALRPSGLRATQFTLLVGVALRGAASITELAEILGMDRTTLTRNLGPLAARGLVDVGAEGWRRARALAITPQGRAVLQEAMPRWEWAQERLRLQLGQEGWEDTQRRLDTLAATV